MQRVSLRKAVEILQEQGIEVSWDEKSSLEDFLIYYDFHYAAKVENGELPGRFFYDDISNIFKKDED